MPMIVRFGDGDVRDDLRWHAEEGIEYTEPTPSDEWSGRKTDLGLVLLSLSAQDRQYLATKGKRWTKLLTGGSSSRAVKLSSERGGGDERSRTGPEGDLYSRCGQQTACC